MRYCASYDHDDKIKELLQEIRFPMAKLNNAIVYAMEHQDKKIIVEIDDIKRHEITDDALIKLITDNNNVYIDFYILNDLIKFSKNFEAQAHIMYHYPVYTWATIQMLLFYKASDVTIGEPLTFQFDKIKNILIKNEISVRVMPHIVFQNVKGEMPYGERHFFITPSQMSLYEDCITVCDLTDKDNAREEALCKVYAKYKNFKANINILIKNIGVDMLTSCFSPEFFQHRMNCNQRCMEDSMSHHSCHYCTAYLNLYQTIRNQKQAEKEAAAPAEEN